MESKACLVALISCICLLQIDAFRQPKCRGKETKLSEEELNIMTDCVKEFGSSTGEMDKTPAATMGCVGKCILQRQGMVDEKGVPMKENIFTVVNATMEADVAKEADEMIGKCIDDNSSGIDMNDKACKTYMPLVECIAKAFMMICHSNSTAT